MNEPRELDRLLAEKHERFLAPETPHYNAAMDAIKEASKWVRAGFEGASLQPTGEDRAELRAGI